MNDSILKELQHLISDNHQNGNNPEPVILEAPEVTILTELPNAIVKFCDGIDKNFHATADRLEMTAAAMRSIADGLTHRAKNLKTAAPELAGQLERWVKYERESNDREKYYSSLFSE